MLSIDSIEVISEIFEKVSQEAITGVVTSSSTTNLALHLASVVIAQNGRSVVAVSSNSISSMLNYTQSKDKQSKSVIGYALEERTECNIPLIGETNPTPLIFSSTNYMCKMMDTLDFDIMIVDSAFSGLLSTELLLFLWHKRFTNGDKVPRLILVSSVSGKSSFLPTFPTVNIGRNDIDITYRPEDDFSEYDNKHFYSTICSRHIGSEMADHKKVKCLNTDVWMIFVPDSSEITLCNEYIQQLDNVEIILMYTDSITNREIDKLGKPAGCKRIIITTSIGEYCGITADIVFDSMLTLKDGKRCKISKKEACIRSSLSTRECYRHISMSKYNSNIIPVGYREIDTGNLSSLMIYLISNNINPYSFLDKAGVDANKIKLVREELETFQLYKKLNGEFILNDLGVFIVKMAGLNTYSASIFHKWIFNRTKSKTKSLYSAAVLVYLLENPIVCGNRNDLAHLVDNNYKNDDLSLNVALYMSIVIKIGSTNFSDRSRVIKACKELKVQFRTVMDFNNNVERLVSTILQEYPEITEDLSEDVDTNVMNVVLDFKSIITDTFKWSNKLVRINDRDDLYVSRANNKIYKWTPVVSENKGKPSSVYLLRGKCMKNKNNRVVNATSMCFSPP